MHSDCHIQVHKRRYSAPYTLVGKQLDVRLCETTVRLYHQHKLFATHPRLKHPGLRSTLDDHLPPEHVAFKMRGPQWCLKQSAEVGEYCHALIEQMFNDRVLERLRAAQGVMGLRKKYGDARLDAACRRALAFENVGYDSVKKILEKGLDQVADPTGAFDQLCETYTGKSRFSRDTADLFKKH